MDYLFDVDGPMQATLLLVFATLQRTAGWPVGKSSCFCMAGFLATVFQAMGAHAEVHACYAVALVAGNHYGLGVRGLTTSSQEVEGHVVCVVEGRYLLDFGTSNLRRYFLPDFPVAVAASLPGSGLFPAATALGVGRSISWHADPANSQAWAAMRDHRGASRLLFEQYQRELHMAMPAAPPAGSRTAQAFA